MELRPFRCWESWFVLHEVQILPVEKLPSIFLFWAVRKFPYKETLLFTASAVKQKGRPWGLAVALLDKAKAAEVASHWYQVGAGCRLLACQSWLSWMRFSWPGNALNRHGAWTCSTSVLCGSPDCPDLCWLLAETLQCNARSAFLNVHLCHSSLIHPPLSEIFYLFYVFLWNTDRDCSTWKFLGLCQTVSNWGFKTASACFFLENWFQQ